MPFAIVCRQVDADDKSAAAPAFSSIWPSSSSARLSLQAAGELVRFLPSASVASASERFSCLLCASPAPGVSHTQRALRQSGRIYRWHAPRLLGVHELRATPQQRRSGCGSLVPTRARFRGSTTYGVLTRSWDNVVGLHRCRVHCESRFCTSSSLPPVRLAMTLLGPGCSPLWGGRCHALPVHHMLTRSLRCWHQDACQQRTGTCCRIALHTLVETKAESQSEPRGICNIRTPD